MVARPTVRPVGLSGARSGTLRPREADLQQAELVFLERDFPALGMVNGGDADWLFLHLRAPCLKIGERRQHVAERPNSVGGDLSHDRRRSAKSRRVRTRRDLHFRVRQLQSFR